MAENIFKEAANAIGTLLFNNNKELITMLRTPTPIKVTQSIVVDPSGCIGGGFDTPNPVALYTCPASVEAWLHIITITVPDYGPANPLTTGEVLCTGSTAGEVIFFLPLHGDIAPISIREGRLSAPHLNPSEVAHLVADQLPAGITIRFDLQIILTTGISEMTPRVHAPGDLDKKHAITIVD